MFHKITFNDLTTKIAESNRLLAVCLSEYRLLVSPFDEIRIDLMLTDKDMNPVKTLQVGTIADCLIAAQDFVIAGLNRYVENAICESFTEEIAYIDSLHRSNDSVFWDGMKDLSDNLHWINNERFIILSNSAIISALRKTKVIEWIHSERIQS